MHAFVPEPSPEAGPSIRSGARVEVGGDGDLQVRRSPDTSIRRFVEEYPRPVGTPIGQGKTKFQEIFETHRRQGQTIYAPFASGDEWQLKLSIVGHKLEVKL